MCGGGVTIFVHRLGLPGKCSLTEFYIQKVNWVNGVLPRGSHRCPGQGPHIGQGGKLRYDEVVAEDSHSDL